MSAEATMKVAEGLYTKGYEYYGIHMTCTYGFPIAYRMLGLWY